MVYFSPGSAERVAIEPTRGTLKCEAALTRTFSSFQCVTGIILLLLLLLVLYVFIQSFLLFLKTRDLATWLTINTARLIYLLDDPSFCTCPLEFHLFVTSHLGT